MQLEAERGAQLLRRGRQAGGIFEVLDVEGLVRPGDELRHESQGSGCVEVVVHEPAELVEGGGVGDRLGQVGRAPGERVESIELALRVADRRGGDLDRRPVVGAQHENPIGPRIVTVGEIEKVGEVAERLGHLLAADLDEAVVHPVAGERATERQRLGMLVLVMGNARS